MKFSKMLKPIDGESLSSYIIRLSKFNYISSNDLFKQLIVAAENKKEKTVLSHRVDVRPQEYIDLNTLSHLTGLDKDALLSLTFIPLERKFIHTSIEKRYELLREVVNFNHRLFCPECIKQYDTNKQPGVYKRIWQVTEIGICDIHNTPLIFTCPSCGTEQPYCSDTIGDYLCNSCYEKLYKNISIDEHNISLTIQQKRNQENWSFLLNNQSMGLIENPKMNYEVQVLLTFLFLIQGRGTLDIDNIPEYVLSKNDIAKAFDYIKYAEMPYFLTPYRLLKGLNYVGLNAEDFFNTQIPIEYINRLLNYLNIDAKQLIEREYRKGIKEYKTGFRTYPIRPIPASTLGRKRVITLEQVEESIKLLIQNNEPISYKTVAEKAGISVRAINKRSDLQELIKRYKGIVEPNI